MEEKPGEDNLEAPRGEDAASAGEETAAYSGDAEEVVEEVGEQPPQLPELFKESTKLGFEAPKHLTTLNAGSIVLIATFLKDIFPRSSNGALAVGLGTKGLIAAAFLFFGVSLLASVLSMYLYVRQFFLVDLRSPESRHVAYGFIIQTSELVLFATFIPFFLGISSFAVAVLIDLL